MKVLRNYILKELLGPLFVSLAVFTFVMIMGNIVKMTDMIINKGVHPFIIFKMILALIPYLLSYTLPMAMITATIMCFGRLASDNEVVAMKANGISLYRIGTPVIILALAISLFQVYLNNNIIPKAHYYARKLAQDVGVKNPTAYLEPGTFIKDFKDYIVFIYSINQNHLNNIRIYKTQPNGPTRTIIAQKGEFVSYPEKEMIMLKLINGTADEPNPKNPNVFYKVNFKTYNITLNLSDKLSQDNVSKKPKDMTIKELREEIQQMKINNVKTTPLIVEIHKKIALAFSSFVFVLIGLPLAINTRRREKSVAFALSILIVLIYYSLFIGGEAMALKEMIPPLVGLWFSNIAYLIIGAVLIIFLAEK